MDSTGPSRTAHVVAEHRAAHQLLEGGRIFADRFACPILGKPADEVRREAEADPARRGRRLFFAARARVAEDALAEAVAARAVTQYVVLGAGLDTFALRNPFGARVRVFEVDHPATQAWKRDRLEAIGAAGAPVFAPCDFERDTLADALAAAGFDPRIRTFFGWLGVVPYLTAPAIDATLAFVAGLPGGGEIAFDHADPPATLAPDHRAAAEALAARVAAAGEPFLTYLSAADAAALLHGHGFTHVEDHDLRRLARFWGLPPERMPERGPHVTVARTG